jgi:hypothetical protein
MSPDTPLFLPQRKNSATRKRRAHISDTYNGLSVLQTQARATGFWRKLMASLRLTIFFPSCGAAAQRRPWPRHV